MNSAPRTDVELAREAYERFDRRRPWNFGAFVDETTNACSIARALGRAETRGDDLSIQERRIIWRALWFEAAEIERDPARSTERAQVYRQLANRIFPHDAREARGEATAPSGTPPPPDLSTPATDDRERVAEALWRAWWRAHGESETEIQFPQIYESARNRWLEIADAGFAAREEPR